MAKTLEIRLLVLHRKEHYAGEYAPEVLAVVDEMTIEDNPAWWDDQIAKEKESIGEDAAAWAVVSVKLPVAHLMSALYPTMVTLELPAEPVPQD